MLDVTENWKTKGILVTLDSEKAFNSLDLSFLLTILEKFAFGTNFIDWVKTFLNDQQLYVINRGATTKYFQLEKSLQQEDPISAHLFI